MAFAPLVHDLPAPWPGFIDRTTVNDESPLNKALSGITRGLSRSGGLAAEGAPAELLARASTHLPLVAALVLVVLLGYYLSRLAWLLYPAGTAEAWEPPPVPAAPPGRASSAPTDYKTIVAAHLFGEATADAAAASGDAALNAPDTSLSLQLHGAVAAESPKLAHAIIADGSGADHIYFQGASLPGGVTLVRVEADRVVLSRGGALEVLRLPRESGQGQAAPPRGPQARTAPPEGGAQPDVQQVVAKNAAGFLDVVRPQPFMPDGQLKGYRIYPGPNRAQFTALGLRPGDLVTEINGTALNNPTQGMEVFRSLGSATQVSLTVERDGQPQVLSLNMDQINATGGATQ